MSTLVFLEDFDLILMTEATLLVRVRAPPETWTTRLGPLGQPEPALLDHLVRLVTIFSNDCSKLQQSEKRLKTNHYRLQKDASTSKRWYLGRPLRRGYRDTGRGGLIRADGKKKPGNLISTPDSEGD